MKHTPDLLALRQHLWSRSQLIAAGHTDGGIQRAVSRREYLRLAPGWYVKTRDWQSFSFVDQHVLRALCAHERVASPPTFSHRTAAALLGLPQLKFDTSKLHVLLPASSARSSCARFIRHHHPYAPEHTQLSGSLMHTDLTRTVVDLARSPGTTDFASAVVTGDAALRRLEQVSIGATDSQRSHRDLMLTQLADLPRTRGVRRARQVLNFLDSSAESPLESLFRLQLSRLGFVVRTQVRVPAPDGGFYRMDFELVGLRVFVEADGRSKFLEPQYLRGRTPGQAAIDERDRENWVSGSQGYRVIRGRWEHALTSQATAQLLRSFNITPPIDLDGNDRLHLY